MKNILFIALLTLSGNTLAGNYEAGINYARIHQNLFDTISFQMDAVIADVAYVHDSGVGFRISSGKSSETVNGLFVQGQHYTNKIDSLWSGTLFYRYQINKWSLEAGVGKTDYKTTWTVNGEIPVWGDNNSDSDWSYYAGFNYEIEDNVTLRVIYADLYRKDKEDHGRETTKGLYVGFAYSF